MYFALIAALLQLMSSFNNNVNIVLPKPIRQGSANICLYKPQPYSILYCEITDKELLHCIVMSVYTLVFAGTNLYWLVTEAYGMCVNDLS